MQIHFKQIIFIVLIALLLTAPVLEVSAYELEYKYPKLPKTEQTFTEASTLPQVIRYWISFAIIVAGIIVLVSLIIAGLQYITSIGRPEAMSSAKSRIWGAFLGLAIVLSSYLILNLVNPQLTIMRIVKTPVESGVLLLSQSARDDLVNGSKTVKELVEQQNPSAYFLYYTLSDPREKLGPLISVETDPSDDHPTKVNYQDIPLDYIALLSGLGQKVRVSVYKELNCKQGSILEQYEYNGRINQDTDQPEAGTFETSGDIHIFNLAEPSPLMPPKSDLYFEPGPPLGREVNLDTEHPLADLYTDVEHPPFSIRIDSIYPGIYLYGENQVTENRYLGAGSSFDFKNPNVSFNDKAKKIRIRNVMQGLAQSFDYITVLFRDPHYKGEPKIYFEKKERVVDVSKPGNPVKETVGNVTEGQLYDIDGTTDKYGTMDSEEASSMWTENLADLEKYPDVCGEVKLCTEITEAGGGDHCLFFTPDENGDIDEDELREGVWVAREKMPFFTPVTLDKDLVVKKLNEDGTIEGDAGDVKFNFNDQIRTIRIRGGCMVMLFQNPVKDPPGTGEDFWDGGEPGDHSQVFTESDFDLRDDKISGCGILVDKLWFVDAKPCASAIVVFPIEGGGGF